MPKRDLSCAGRDDGLRGCLQLRGCLWVLRGSTADESNGACRADPMTAATPIAAHRMGRQPTRFADVAEWPKNPSGGSGKSARPCMVWMHGRARLQSVSDHAAAMLQASADVAQLAGASFVSRALSGLRNRLRVQAPAAGGSRARRGAAARGSRSRTPAAPRRGRPQGRDRLGHQPAIGREGPAGLAAQRGRGAQALRARLRALRPHGSPWLAPRERPRLPHTARRVPLRVDRLPAQGPGVRDDERTARGRARIPRPPALHPNHPAHPPAPRADGPDPLSPHRAPGSARGQAGLPPRSHSLLKLCRPAVGSGSRGGFHPPALLPPRRWRFR